MKDGDATSFEVCDSYLFQYQVFIRQLYKVNGGKWRSSLSGRRWLSSSCYTACAISVHQSYTLFNLQLPNGKHIYGGSLIRHGQGPTHMDNGMMVGQIRDGN